jgi:hypothetical protein
MDPAKIREALGLAADASDQDVTAKLAEAGLAPTPTGPSGGNEDPDLDAALEKLVRESEEEANRQPAGAELSAETQAAIDLANSRAEEAQATARNLAAQLAKSQFDSYKAELVGAGVPPADVDLAAPILSLPGSTVIDLSNSGGEKVDVTGIVRNLLEARKGTVDLSNERGTLSRAGESEDAETAASLELWEKQFPAKR